MTKRILTQVLAAVVLAMTFAGLSGCNTVAGAGQDLQAGGRKLTGEAREQQAK
ncbi:MAG TPA: entericidin A/B family lipoprotein [Burkholderiales bacterium]|nr:entericidin A/B family lipoprotein [Burkholderiales bacterium]